MLLEKDDGLAGNARAPPTLHTTWSWKDERGGLGEVVRGILYR